MSSDSPVAPAATQPSIAVIRKRRAQPLFGRHPWVFSGAIDRIEFPGDDEPGAGACVQVRSHEGKFIGWGLLNPASNIRIRMYSWEESVSINRDLLAHRIRAACASRRSLIDLNAAGIARRIVFSEADELSGLVADWYDGYLLIQFTSLALYRFRDIIVELLQQELNPRGIWLRTEKGMRDAEELEAVDGLVLGEEPPRPLFVREGELQFGVDVQQGQKTGFYLDQRLTRQAICRYTHEHRVLDAFCFSGSFGITAVTSGQATRSLGIDSSATALELARANADLNGVGDRCEFQQGDAKVVLHELAEQGRDFDTLILDPPRMARTRAGVDRALKGYQRLNRIGLRVLRPGGILVTCSCSGLVPRDLFHEVIADAARQSGRHIRILESLGQPDDHPVSAVCAETEYLKVCICRVS